MSQNTKFAHSKLFRRLILLIVVAVWATYFWGPSRDSIDPNGEIDVSPDDRTVNADEIEDEEVRKLFAVPTADLTQPEVLIESFEWGRDQVITWAGGNISREHATDGKQSFQVVFNPLSRDFKCRLGAIPPDFSRHRKILIDTFNPEGPFYLGFRLSGADGQTHYTFPPTQVTSGASTLEFDLRLPEFRGFDLSQVGEVGFMRAVTASTVTAYYDNLRLAHEGTGTYDFFDEPPSTARESEPGYVPDGEFSEGLSLWSVKPLPGSLWTLSLGRGDDAWDGGPSLALYGRNEGGVELVAPELELPPGRYRATYRVRGSGDVSCNLELREEILRSWRTLSGTQTSSRPIGEEWQVFEEKFHVLPDDSSPEGSEGIRVMSLALIVSGSGDCVVDSVRLESESGGVPESMDASHYEVPRAEYETGDPSAWHGIRRSFPIFYREDALLVDESARVFRVFCRALGLQAAVDFGRALHSNMPGKVLEMIERRKPDASVGAWLLTSAADWSLCHVPTSLVRGLGDRIAELDPRLVAVGLESNDMSSQFRHIDAAGAIFIGTSSGALDKESLEEFETTLEHAADVVRVSGGTFLARVTVTDRSLRQKSFLARIQGASGLVLEPPPHSMVGDLVWQAARDLVKETAEMTEKLRGADALAVETSHESVRVRGYRTGNRALLLIMSLWPKGLDGVTFKTELGNHTLNLTAFEATTVELGEE
jgi:hypothetical protein